MARATDADGRAYLQPFLQNTSGVERSELAERFNAIRLARLIGFRGSALRVAGRYREAEEHFSEALRLIADRSPADKGDVLRRLGVVK